MQSNKTTIIITTTILILTIIAAIGASMATSGCLDFGADDTVVTTSTDHIPTPEPIEPTLVETETPVEIPITEPVETPWYVNKTGFEGETIETYQTLFNGTDVVAVKGSAYGEGNYNLFDAQTEGLHILTHQEFTPSNLRLDLEMSSDQYRELNAQYGTLVSATMETIDNDPTHAGMDQVAIHYVGTGGDEWNFKREYHEGWRLVDYLYMELVK